MLKVEVSFGGSKLEWALYCEIFPSSQIFSLVTTAAWCDAGSGWLDLNRLSVTSIMVTMVSVHSYSIHSHIIGEEINSDNSKNQIALQAIILKNSLSKVGEKS